MNAEDLFDPQALAKWRADREGFPHAFTIEHGPAGLPGALQVYYQPGGCLWLADHGGFLCRLRGDEAIVELEEILRVEFDHPGALRKALTGQSYRWDERNRGLKRTQPITLDDIIGDLT